MRWFCLQSGSMRNRTVFRLKYCQFLQIYLPELCSKERERERWRNSNVNDNMLGQLNTTRPSHVAHCRQLDRTRSSALTWQSPHNNRDCKLLGDLFAVCEKPICSSGEIDTIISLSLNFFDWESLLLNSRGKEDLCELEQVKLASQNQCKTQEREATLIVCVMLCAEREWVGCRTSAYSFNFKICE